MKTSILSILFTIAFAAFAVIQNTQAVSPAPDGAYSGGNTKEGQNSLLSLTSGIYNTGIGIYSLLSLTDGNFWTAVGAGMLLPTPQIKNTATGAGALLSNTTGGTNTANGAFALFSNTEGNFNTASGRSALLSNTTAGANTANGYQALFNNTIGNDNMASGANALLSNISGNNNTALRRSAGSDINGSSNICIGQGVSGEAGVDDSTYIRSVNTTERSPAEDVVLLLFVCLTAGLGTSLQWCAVPPLSCKRQ
jgi:hypothetical protein